MMQNIKENLKNAKFERKMEGLLNRVVQWCLTDLFQNHFKKCLPRLHGVFVLIKLQSAFDIS